MKEMAFPRTKVYIQTGIPHLIPASIVGLTRHDVNEAPGLSLEFIPGHVDERLSRSLGEIHDDKVTLLALDPAPTQNIQIALVVRPAGPLTELPLTIPEDVIVDRLQEAMIEGHKVRIDLLNRTAAEEYRKPNLPSLELPFVKEFCARNSGDGYSDGTLLLGEEH